MLALVTFNSNTWKAAEEYLSGLGATHRDAVMLMFQEHKLLQPQAGEQGSRLAAARWASLWEPALLTQKGGRSGGVGIAANAYLDVWGDQSTALSGAAELATNGAVTKLAGRVRQCWLRTRNMVFFSNLQRVLLCLARGGARGPTMLPC